MMKAIVCCISLLCLIAIVHSAMDPQVLEPDGQFVADLLHSVKLQILNRDSSYEPVNFRKIFKAWEMPSNKANARTFKVNFLLETYIPDRPESKMYRMLFCTAKITTFNQIKLHDRLDSLDCAQIPEQ